MATDDRTIPPDPPPGAAGAIRRFVVLTHRWDGVHWDFLVEDGATLRTWAVDAPIVAGADLPARALAPHRRVYLDYEGPIAGDRGTVERWDRGWADVEAWGERLVRLRVEGGQLVGLVELRAEGGAADADEPRRWVFRLGKLS